MAEARFSFAGEVRPVCEIGISETRLAEPTSWLDVSCFVHEAELFRGRERFNERFEPGTASVTFTNDDGWADLGGTYAEVAAAELRPGRQIRIGVHGPWNPGMAPFVRWLYRGFIDQATPAYDPVAHDVVTVNCIDALGESGSSTAPTGAHQGVNETASARINRVLDAVGWWGSKRKIDVSATTVQGTSLGGAAIDHMGQAADSAGGVVFGDLDGDVVFKDIDWMLYDPDVPPDATIGPGDPGAPPGDTPPYIDPSEGPVFDPDDPPATVPPKVCVCADGTAGTLVEKGDNYRLFVRDGHLFYESSGSTWDLGPYSGGCTCVDPDGGTPERSDDPDEDGDYDINPFEPVEVPTFGVELLDWNDGGFADAPAAAVTVTGIAPGHDCLLVVLINAIGSATNATGLAPVVDGGGLDWAHQRAEDQAGDGASSFIVVAPVGRTDPGTFAVTATWAAPNTTRSHIVTVWKVTAAVNDYLERFDAGLVLYGLTDSNPPDEVEPGNGPTTVELAADRQPADVDTPTRTVDITIAQTLAEESLPPFGATFATLDPAWIVPDNVPSLPTVVVALAPAFTDDFERADGALGADWQAPGGYPTVGTTDGVPTISSGEAVAATDTDAIALYVVAIPGDHYIEAEVTNWRVVGTAPGRTVQMGLVTRMDPAAFTGHTTRFIMSTAAQDGGAVNMDQYTTGTRIGPGNVGFIEPADTFRMRVESTVDVDGGVSNHALYIDDIFATDNDSALLTGEYVGIWIRWSGSGGSPRLNWVEAGTLGAERKASWTAGWRVGAASNLVQFADVNLGTANIQSAQAALVLESPEPEGGWRVLDYQLAAVTTGATPAGTFTLDNTPRPGSLVVVFVGMTASTDVVDSVTVTGATFTRTVVRHQAGSSWGRVRCSPPSPRSTSTRASWAVTVNYPACESVSAVVYEVAVQDDDTPVGVTASGVLGTNTAGSVNGASTITLSAAGDPAAVVLAYLHVAAAASSTSGATTVEGDEWHEELQYSPAAQRGYLQTMSRAPGQPESTSTAVHWEDTQTGTAATYSAVQLAVEVKPYDGLATTGAGSGVYLGGVTDPWNGTITSAYAYMPDGTPIWEFPGGF